MFSKIIVGGGSICYMEVIMTIRVIQYFNHLIGFSIFGDTNRLNSLRNNFYF